MSRVALNVASRPFLNRKPWLALLAALGLSGGLLSFENAYRIAEALAAKRGLQLEREAQVRLLDQVRKANANAEANLTERIKKRTRDVAGFARNQLKARTLSWTALFNDLESVTPRDLRINSIAPEITSTEVKLRMECVAKNNEVKLELYDKLYEAPFDDPWILSENQSDAGLQFSITCRYRPSPPPESATLVSTEAQP